eukprot:1157097-Pelagomonas_calceolata.AAC.3
MRQTGAQGFTSLVRDGAAYDTHGYSPPPKTAQGSLASAQNLQDRSAIHALTSKLRLQKET